MKFGLGSFEAPFPANPSNKKRPTDADAMYREMRVEMGRARIFCPYPPGSSQPFRESALVISTTWPVRYEIQKQHGWVVTVYDVQHVGAENWVLQESADFFEPRELTPSERQSVLDSLTPDDTAWWYRFEASTREVEILMRNNIGPNYQMASEAEWFAAVTAACFMKGVDNSGYILDRTDIPDCPTVPVQRSTGGGPLRRKVEAQRRVWQDVQTRFRRRR